MALNVVLVLAGLVVLAKEADVFVLGAARLAVAIRISPVVVGAVIVGFGTGTPELLVSSLAAFRGELDLAAGNVVGSTWPTSPSSWALPASSPSPESWPG